MKNPISKAQYACIHALLNKLHLTAKKEEILRIFSNCRTGSCKELSSYEANAIILHLKSLDPEEVGAEKMRRKIISMAHEMGWRIPGTRKADMQRIDAWMVKSSYLHKKINQYRYAELPKLVTQFEAVYKSFLKGI